jgi:putative hydrolase of the HAD superfamily
MPVKAVGFDFFGTLVEATADANDCIHSMCKHLHSCGYNFEFEDFIQAYREVVSEHRKIRYEKFREVNNCIWVASTMEKMGFNTKSSDQEIVSAVKEYFNVWQLVMFPEVYDSLERINKKFKTALVSNFTDSQFLYESLKRLRIEPFFDSIIISDSYGWRKPHSKIFTHFLNSLDVKAEEAIFVGDDLEADIKGAKDSGITTVLIIRQSNKKRKCNQDILPDHTVNSLLELEKLLIQN